MPQKRKLQVFVSSTYTDLKEERQAAVEAILTAGHIPAGMELFAAGDESQMAVIRRWIDESDVYLLLLGGRYGSIEPVSGKSYTQLEYEYALDKGKALFAVVITDRQLDEKNRREGKQVLELENPQKLKDFKNLVTSKLVKFWDDHRDIKLAVLQTLPEFDRREDLTGWIPGNEATNAGAIAEELASLSKENAELRSQVANRPTDLNSYNGLDFDEAFDFLAKRLIPEECINSNYMTLMKNVNNQFTGYPRPGVVVLFWLWANISPNYALNTYRNQIAEFMLEPLREIKLIEELQTAIGIRNAGKYVFTELGKRFILRMKVSHGRQEVINETQQFMNYVGDQLFDPIIKRNY